MTLYFDHCATTPPFEEVVEAMTEVMQRYYGNPSSIHHIGMEAERMVVRARALIAQLLGVKSSEIVFTSGGTESNNLAVKGAAFQYASRGRHLITTELEHASVYEACKQLETFGYEVTYLRPDAEGRIRPEDVEAALREDTTLVSIMHVNNEVGAIQPIREIGQLLKGRPRTLFHVDAVQGFAKLPLEPAQWGIDLLSVSAHKLRGPKGIGFLYRRHGVQLQPLLAGGGQEHGIRSGTENVPAIVGMAKAVRMSMERREQAEAKLRALRARFLNRLASPPSIRVNGSPEPERMAPHIVHISVPGIRSEIIVHALEKQELFISTKSACSSGEMEPSRVLLAMGLDRAAASSGLRVSFSSDHTVQEADRLADALIQAIEELARLS
ncbi:cysteine desulfurase family protein [Paenibacillus koleovorans]|uniref:cysteine desulfurase family protein n=1 Tax=Paenibacillus koleovorans TaxID=121608 RepID=UPI000FD9BD29|nr:cysteine desulfurase family protein [Paenibacillus koleovorans]